jgi:hypothetical protein
VRALPVLVTVLTLALAGCGGNTKEKNDYVGSVNRAQSQFQTTFDRLQTRITATSTAAQDQKTLQRFREAVDGLLADLRHIKPPSGVKDLHGDLVGEVGQYGKVVDDAKRRFRSRDPQVVVKANTDFAAAVTRTSQAITATIDQINRKLQA